MVDIQTEVFNAVYTAVIAEVPETDLADHYVNQPAAFPHIQLWDESNTTNYAGMNLSGVECFSNIVYHFEFFDNGPNGEGKVMVEKLLAIVDPVMRLMGFRRTYSAPVPNFDDASVFRKVARYSKIQPNN